MVEPLGRSVTGVLAQEITNRLQLPCYAILVRCAEHHLGSSVGRNPFKPLPFQRVALECRNDCFGDSLIGATAADRSGSEIEIERSDLLGSRSTFVKCGEVSHHGWTCRGQPSDGRPVEP